MGYSVKWVVDNLGITRDMLRYYESKNLLSVDGSRNPANNYRDYSDEDIERIWGIRLLIGIGFSADEVYELMHNPEFDFDTAIAKKVAELERKHDENIRYLEFAKGIKVTGRIPTASKIGSIRFDDFLAYAREKWKFSTNSQSASAIEIAGTLISKEQQEWSPDDVARVLEMLEGFDPERIMHIYALHGYYQVISDMRELGYDSDTVQRVVRLLHKYMIDHSSELEIDVEITTQFIAKHTASLFLGGDIALLQERNYGKEGCLFIAKALAYYGGYNIEDL